MNKIIIYTVLNLLTVAVLYLLYTPFSNPKLVYVDADKLVNDYAGMAETQAAFKETLQNGWNKAMEDYRNEEAAMSAKEQALARELIETNRQQFLNYQEAVSDMAARRDQEMTHAVLEEVNGYLAEYAKKHGHAIILAATSYGNVAYANQELDITEEVLKGLNKNHEGQ